MKKKLEDYLEKSGLILPNAETDLQFLEKIRDILEHTNLKNAEGLLKYPVPRISKDGLCSVSGKLADEPYDLGKVFEYNSIDTGKASLLISRLDEITEFLNTELNSSWSGVYKKLNTKDGPALIKLSYRGKPSRAEFPLTPEFAKHSNNSTVGLSGKAINIRNIVEHIKSGGSYYTCNVEAKSELCLPIFSLSGELTGIIEFEGLVENAFDDKKIKKVAIACVMMSEIL